MLTFIIIIIIDIVAAVIFLDLCFFNVDEGCLIF